MRSLAVWPLSRRLPPITLTGPRIYLCPPKWDDCTDWIAVRTRNESALKPYEPVWPDKCLTPSFFRARLRRQYRDWHDHLARYFLIRLQDTNALIGGININHICLGAARHGSLGYWLDRDHQGQGYMGEAIGCVLDYAFKGMHFQRIQAACIPENEKSMRILRHAGFTEEGFARAYLQINGMWRDHHLFAITAQDYARPALVDKTAGSMPSAA